MRRFLLSAVSAGTLIVGGATAFPAAPASASLPPVCEFVQVGPGLQQCDFDGVGPVGTVTIEVTGGRSTVVVDCDGLRVFQLTSTGPVNAGTYSRSSVTTSTCRASLSASALVTTATVT